MFNIGNTILIKNLPKQVFKNETYKKTKYQFKEKNSHHY